MSVLGHAQALYERLKWVGLVALIVQSVGWGVAVAQFGASVWMSATFALWFAACLLALPRALREERAWAFYVALGAISVLAGLGLYGASSPRQAPQYILSMIVLSTLLPLKRALGFGGLLCGLVLLVSWQLPAPERLRHWAMFLTPAIPLIAFGAILRWSLLSAIKAQEATRKLNRVNETLEVALRASDELSVAQERARLARELHDSIGHSLTIGAVQLEAAQVLLQTAQQEQAEQALRSAQDALRTGLDELRSCVSVLREDTRTQTLGELIDELVQGARHAGWEVHLEIEGSQRRLGPAREFALYRFVQEALTNAAKHAQATQVHVHLEFSDAEVVLQVWDNGRGAPQLERGQGILGLRERARELGAHLEVRSAPGQGVRLKVQLNG